MKEEGRIFDPRVVVAVVAAGIAAFAGFLLLFAYADDFRAERDGRPHPLSVSAIGYSGLVKLIRLGGGQAKMIRNPVDRDTEDLVVATLEEETDAGPVKDLLAARGDRPTLLVLPKWFVAKNPKRGDWVVAAGVLPPPMVAAALRDLGDIQVVDTKVRGHGLARGENYLDGLSTPVPNALQSLRGKGLRPLLTGPAGRLLVAQVGDKPVFILADPDLLNNKGLKDKTTAASALDLLDALSPEGARSISFDLVINGLGRKPGALKLAFEPPFLALTIALFVAALLAGLHGAFRFGPALAEARAVAFGKSALVENSAGLFRLARREAAVGPAYAELIRDAAAHDSGAPSAMQGETLEAYLDRLSPDAPFSELAERARAAGDRFALLAAARALFSWKKDLIP